MWVGIMLKTLRIQQKFSNISFPGVADTRLPGLFLTIRLGGTVPALDFSMTSLAVAAIFVPAGGVVGTSFLNNLPFTNIACIACISHFDFHIFPFYPTDSTPFLSIPFSFVFFLLGPLQHYSLVGLGSGCLRRKERKLGQETDRGSWRERVVQCRDIHFI